MTTVLPRELIRGRICVLGPRSGSQFVQRRAPEISARQFVRAVLIKACPRPMARRLLARESKPADDRTMLGWERNGAE
jgi:hypothetical protein